MARSYAFASTILGLAAIAAFPALLDAQQISSPYRFIDENLAAGVFAGYFFGDPGSAEVGPRDGRIVGLRLTIRATGPLNIEAQTGVISTDRIVWAVDSETDEIVKAGEADLSMLHVGGSLRFDVTGPRTFYNLMPFVAAGGGVVLRLTENDTFDQLLPFEEQFDLGTTFAAHVGTGVEWFPFGRVTLRADGQVLLYRMNTPVAFLDIDPTLPTREWAQNYIVSASVSYRF
ncbi:MAG TPA: hypothetical protein VNZ57_01500 [Longimicrobiales bacterium]|nr:hypothetical protein [Longimicrobiales bacterium]